MTIGRGKTLRGVHPTRCLYQALDGPFVMVAGDASSKFLQRLSLPITYRAISHWVGTHRAHEIAALLEGTGVTATCLRSTAELRRRYTFPESSPPTIGSTYHFTAFDDHPLGHVVIVSSIAMRFDGMQCRAVNNTAPKYGRDSMDVLRSVSRSRVLLGGSAALAYSRHYLPAPPRCTGCAHTEHLSVLECFHHLCRTCVMTLSVCPVCGNDEVLPLRQRVLSAAYRMWRRGSKRGAVERLFSRQIVLRRVMSGPV